LRATGSRADERPEAAPEGRAVPEEPAPDLIRGRWGCVRWRRRFRALRCAPAVVPWRVSEWDGDVRYVFPKIDILLDSYMLGNSFREALPCHPMPNHGPEELPRRPQYRP
jgi:hypothetical protein